MLPYLVPFPAPVGPRHFREHLTAGQALVVYVLPAGVGCVVPGVVIGSIAGLVLRRFLRPRFSRNPLAQPSSHDTWPPAPDVR